MPRKFDIFTILDNSKFKSAAAQLAEAFADAGIVRQDQVHNAPVLVRTTYGADIYEVVALLEDPPKKEVKRDHKAKDQS